MERSRILGIGIVDVSPVGCTRQPRAAAALLLVGLTAVTVFAQARCSFPLNRSRGTHPANNTQATCPDRDAGKG